MTVFAIARRNVFWCRARQLTTLQANQRPRLPRYIGIAVLATFATAASAYLLLPSGPSRAAPTLAEEPLSVDYFTPSVVLESKDATPDTKIITLRVDPALIPPCLMRRSVPSANEADSEERKNTPIYSVFVKDSDIQVERPYTPLERADEEGKMHFWIKRYEKGEVGRWLHARKVGDTVELRGPELTWDWSWRQGDWDEVVMISGGTGITPFYQFLHSLSTYPSKRTRYTLLHSSRTPADLPPPSILKPLTMLATECPDVFKMHLFVDSIPNDSRTNAIDGSLRVGRVGKTAIEHSLSLNKINWSWWPLPWGKNEEVPRKKILFLVCGPEPMISAISGPYGRNFSQGPVGGVLGEMGYTSKEVWKL